MRLISVAASTLAVGLIFGLTSCELFDAANDAANGGTVNLSMSGGCSYTGQIIYTVDGAAHPGDVLGVHIPVEPGHHDVGASIDNGNYFYANSTVNVPTGGSGTRVFPCPQPVVHVTVDGNCGGKSININLFLDGVLLAQVQPGQGSARETTKGPHAVTANGTSGYTWSATKTLEWADAWDLILECGGEHSSASTRSSVTRN